MKRAFGMVLAGLAGIVMGAGGMDALRAATAEAPAFLIGNIQAVNDPAIYRQYQQAVLATHEPFGGHFLVRGAHAVVLDTSAQPPGTIVVLAFPNMKALRGWWNSPAYAALRPLREKATRGQLYAVEGVAAP
jgi:uncharacterized protein (DUF1330 family)